MNMNPISIDDIKNLSDKLKPKKIIVTSDKKVYSELLESSCFNKECIKFSKLFNGTFIVDVEKLNKWEQNKE